MFATFACVNLLGWMMEVKNCPRNGCICINTLSDCVAEDVETTSDFTACYDFPSTGWASSCLIVCKIRVQEYIDAVSLDPFVALSLFLTSQAITINDILCPDDPIIQYLYTLALYKGIKFGLEIKIYNLKTTH
jgi:hypothetical protein